MIWNGAERRRFVRVVYLCKVKLIANSRMLFSHTENIGEGGVKIVLREKLEPDTLVELHIMMENNRIVKCKGKIRWAMKKAESRDKQPELFDVGVEFTEIDKADRLYIKMIVEKILALEKR